MYVKAATARRGGGRGPSRYFVEPDGKVSQRTYTHNLYTPYLTRTCNSVHRTLRTCTRKHEIVTRGGGRGPLRYFVEPDGKVCTYTHH
jgi:hypothetical protein